MGLKRRKSAYAMYHETKLATFYERLLERRKAERSLIEYEKRECARVEAENRAAEGARWRAFLEDCEGRTRPAATVLEWPRREAR